MKRSTLVIAPFVCLIMIASNALAQQGPPPGPPDGQGPPPGQRDGGGGGGRGGRMGGPGGGGGGMQRDGGGGPDGMGPGGGGQRGPMNQIQMLRGYIDLVESMSRLSKDPNAAGVAAVISAADVLKPRGPDAAIDYFNKLLPDTKSPAVQRAIRIQLIDLYKASGQQEKALDQVRTLVTGAAGDEAAR